MTGSREYWGVRQRPETQRDARAGAGRRRQRGLGVPGMQAAFRALLLAVLLVVQVLRLGGQRGEQAAQVVARRESNDVVGREQLQLLGVELREQERSCVGLSRLGPGLRHAGGIRRS
ncbi:hypothetical protein NDU88_007168 [Pleurodeles waltl]|uniref:Uncharacterized protein n=1 Tax=Pleurodeles waltl TaxID=8319 RepID=A0AAV7UN50_PLEWA|nr:hypothetical protein NDU88_007168 [Pleurodeles waltl]